MPSLLEETRLLQCMEKPNDRRLLSQNSSVIVTRKERGGEEKKKKSHHLEGSAKKYLTSKRYKETPTSLLSTNH